MQWSRRSNKGPRSTPRKRRAWKVFAYIALTFTVLCTIGRLILPSVVTWSVNRTISRNPLYAGRIDSVEINLWRGAYTINEITLSKTTGNVPVPLFGAKKLDFAIQWNALLHGEVVGVISMEQAELNFVDAPDESSSQTGAGGPWLDMLADLFPFKINRCDIHNSSIHFRAYQTDPPVDVYLSQLEASIENLTNISEDTAPLISTVTAHALAMDHAQLDYQMKFDPTSYRPAFQLAVKLVGLDVTKVNNLGRAYGKFDAERGWFDLVVELDAKGGGVTGYVKPLFRNLQILGWQDVKEDNILGVFWEALVGGSTKLLTNVPRDQFGTIIPLSGDLTNPQADILSTVGNVLRNAFVRAYLPKLQGTAKEIDGLQFGVGSVIDPAAPGDDTK